MYGLIGLVLLKMRGAKDKTALIVAIGIYGYLLVSMGSSALFLDFSSIVDPAAAQQAARATSEGLAGGWGSVIAEHVKALPLYGLSQVSMQGPTTLAMVLLGMRRQREHRRGAGQRTDRSVPGRGVRSHAAAACAQRPRPRVGQVSPLETMLIAFAIFAAQLVGQPLVGPAVRLRSGRVGAARRHERRAAGVPAGCA